MRADCRKQWTVQGFGRAVDSQSISLSPDNPLECHNIQSENRILWHLGQAFKIFMSHNILHNVYVVLSAVLEMSDFCIGNIDLLTGLSIAGVNSQSFRQDTIFPKYCTVASHHTPVSQGIDTFG